MRVIFIGRSKVEIRDLGLVSSPGLSLKLGHDQVFPRVKKMGPRNNYRD